jgi:Ca2+-binding EF-hand superfamily protein
VINNFLFSPKDISDFWKMFQKLDKAKTGLVPLITIFHKIEMERNLITDCLLELLEIDHDGEINFSDFLYMVTQ